MERKVKIESMVNHTVVLSEPYTRFSRVFNRDEQSALVDFETMEQGMQLNGFRKMFTNGTLRIVDEKDKIDLGLAAAGDEDQVEEIFTISTGEIVKLFKSKDYKKIQEIVNKSSTETIENMISTMIKFKLFDDSIINILQKKSPNNVKLYKLISLAEDAEKEDFDYED